MRWLLDTGVLIAAERAGVLAGFLDWAEDLGSGISSAAHDEFARNTKEIRRGDRLRWQETRLVRFELPCCGNCERSAPTWGMISGSTRPSL